MITFQLERTAPLPMAEAWHRLTDWPRHGAAVPLTRVSVRTAPPTGRGTVVVARTGVGPVGFDDPMEITLWQPPGEDSPGRCRLDKRGRVVRGWAEIEVRPGPGGRTRVLWREQLGFRFLPRLADPLVERTAVVVFGREVNRLLRQG
ncbi:SRPBCC family protein [Streptomyces sp. NPDC048290]|uniref:SRPBCC family protein n=1 Tax=Streptomyces sp. NPDC048290 TaxID=3155811 RepID=UPI0034400BD8